MKNEPTQSISANGVAQLSGEYGASPVGVTCKPTNSKALRSRVRAIVGMLLALLLAPASHAATSSSDSNLTTVDTRSYLKLAAPAHDAAGGIRLVWGSVPNKLYTLLRSTAVDTGWAPVAEHVLSTPPENVFVDLTATSSSVYFCRLKVE